MAPKRTTRSTRVPPVTPAPTTTTVTEAQLQALIDQGVAAAMAEAEASRTTTTEAAHAMPCAALKKICRQDDMYIGGLPDMILGSVKASKSKTMQEVIEFTTELMEDKTQAYAERQAERKRKYDDLSNNNQNQQNKRQNTGQAYTAGNSDRKPYAGSKPLCSKCNYNHEGLVHIGDITARGLAIWPETVEVGLQMTTTTTTGNGCFECGAQGHFKRNCPRLRNNDRGNQAGNDRALAKVYVVECWGKTQTRRCGAEVHGKRISYLLHMVTANEVRQVGVEDELEGRLAGYYRRFIEGFSKIAKPMTKLTQKKVSLSGAITEELFTVEEKLFAVLQSLHY
ncbi:putative reverse transcriptase domain-containing protein [Tanacetum coccineum]|uniref:Reverse transcriptase domain-containing protein n=1 Tax=Tanacetum coccineum TaxID=301880 RepID=A0ABQ5ACY8_9ASTR